MAVKIRLMRIGAKKRPFYRVVAVDEHKKRTGGYLELLGTYNPLTEPKEINLKQDRIDDWMKKGAVGSDGFLRIIGKAPQRPPRKPKKEKAPEATPAPAIPEPTAETTPTEETPPTKENSSTTEAEPAAETQDQNNTEATVVETPAENPEPKETVEETKPE